MTGQATPARPRRVTAGGLAILGAILLFGALLIGGGVQLIIQRETGDRTDATVTRCVDRGSSRNRSTHCTGTWVTGGSLVDGGRVRVGTVDGATSGDVGKTVDVTLSTDGETAYLRSLAKPLMLIGLGLLTLLLAIVLLRGMLRGR